MKKILIFIFCIISMNIESSQGPLFPRRHVTICEFKSEHDSEVLCIQAKNSQSRNLLFECQFKPEKNKWELVECKGLI